MTEVPYTWEVLGRRITLQAAPETIARLQEALHLVEKKVAGLAQQHPSADEWTLWLMAILATYDELLDRLAQYEAFCQRIEAWLHHLDKPSQV